MTYLLQGLVAFGLSAILIVWLRRPALRFGLVDNPGGRKRHGDSVPVTGGLAVTVSIFATIALSLHKMGDYRVLFAVMLLLGAIGVLDDIGEITPRSKLSAQVIAAVLMTSWGNHFLTGLGDILARGPIALANWGIPLTVFATVAVINGINMLDGLDGLAGGLVLQILVYFTGFAWLSADANALKLLLVSAGAVAGFMVFNAPHPWRGRRRVFMGDAGALVLGFLIVWFAIELSQRDAAAVPPVVMLWVVGVVLFDVFTVTVRRLIRRRDPVVPDRAHIHHLLLRRGLSPPLTVTVVIGGNLALGAIGTAGWLMGFPDYVLFAGFVAIGLMYLAAFLFPGRFMRLGRSRTAGS